ncbi:MAG: Tm-1-like ATP-binding domain-containing protein, partial [Deltaproteobacteria bacterium]|nr:Tm-1-like ATP-binding domain-containing protein [Deltaproteobacteria bacterium]
MGKKIIVIGTLDTRGEEIGYLAEEIRKRGHDAKVMDVGVLGEVPFKPAIERDQVAQAAGTSIREIIELGHEGRAMSAMAAGVYRILKELHQRRQVDGVIAAGGSMSTSLALEAMQYLPLGLPKVLLSLWPAGLHGLNRISRNVLRTAAGVIAGAAEARVEEERERKKTVGVTSLGTSQQKFIVRLKPALEERGYDVAVFHTLGMGGQAFEQAIRDGLIDVSLDFSLVELMDHVVGGATTSGKIRLKAAAEKGI